MLNKLKTSAKIGLSVITPQTLIIQHLYMEQTEACGSVWPHDADKEHFIYYVLVRLKLYNPLKLIIKHH